VDVKDRKNGVDPDPGNAKLRGSEQQRIGTRYRGAVSFIAFYQ